MAKIAIFGGTFNPFHIGHYEMLKCICGLDFIDKVFLTPDKIPPHKKCDFLADDEHRIEMCRIISREFNKCELCLIEFEREGKSYTYDTVCDLKQKYPNDIFYWVIGGDMLETLDKWYNFNELFKNISFIAFARGDINKAKLDAEKMRKLGANITLLDTQITDISSTEFRNNKKEYMLPPKIYDYIINKGIYNE